MGNCAPRNLQPLGLDNKCTDYAASETFPGVGYDYNYLQVTDGCSPWGAAGVSYRESVCEQIGNYSGEWEPYVDTGTTIPLPAPHSQDYTTTGPNGCAYNSCNGVQDFRATGCCEGCCGISGVKIFCRRKKYRANPVNCCFLDKNFTADPASCFASGQQNVGGIISDPMQQATCDPNFRDINGAGCMDKVEQYCSGADDSQGSDPNDIRWMDRWLNGDKACIYALNRRLYNLPYGSNPPFFIGPGMNFIDPNTVLPSNIRPDGNIFARRIIASAIQKYSDQGYQLGVKAGAIGYHPFQELLQDICTKSPGMCQDGLYNACSSLTAKQLSTRPDLIKWCGCYLPPQEYEKYTNQFQLSVECTPLCSRPEAIKLAAENGLTEKTCTQDACIIDDINIALANTTVQGSIKFNQICGGCTGNCRCMMSNVTLLAANSSIGGNIDLSQTCGGVIQCYTDDPKTGKPVQSPCDDNDAAGQLAQLEARQKAAAEASRKRSQWIWVGIAVGVAAIGFIIYLLTRDGSKLGSYNGDRQPPAGPAASVHSLAAAPINSTPYLPPAPTFLVNSTPYSSPAPVLTRTTSYSIPPSLLSISRPAPLYNSSSIAPSPPGPSSNSATSSSFNTNSTLNPLPPI